MPATSRRHCWRCSEAFALCPSRWTPRGTQQRKWFVVSPLEGTTHSKQIILNYMHGSQYMYVVYIIRNGVNLRKVAKIQNLRDFNRRWATVVIHPLATFLGFFQTKYEEKNLDIVIII
jgi:hypothetical protein